MWKRLVTFGCSITYGQGLPDCNPIGPEPSKFAWPQLVSNDLKRLCINKSAPGASNKKIWHTINNFDFLDTDVVVILWTTLERHTIFYDVNNHLDIGNWMTDNIAKEYYTKFHNDYDALITNKLYVYYANTYLKDINIPVFNLVTWKDCASIFNFGYKVFPHIPTYILNDYCYKYPLALDNAHPGIEANKRFANDISTHIKKTLHI